MEALVDKVHKQGEHIPQHCYISHNHLTNCSSLGNFLTIESCLTMSLLALRCNTTSCLLLTKSSCKHYYIDWNRHTCTSCSHVFFYTKNMYSSGIAAWIKLNYKFAWQKVEFCTVELKFVVAIHALIEVRVTLCYNFKVNGSLLDSIRRRAGISESSVFDVPLSTACDLVFFHNNWRLR